jgi:hypothetical protein
MPIASHLTEGPDWKSLDEAASDLSAIGRQISLPDSFYSSAENILQEVTLQEIEPKATAHFFKTPDWDLFLYVDSKQAFKIANLRERANNILHGTFGAKRVH